MTIFMHCYEMENDSMWEKKPNDPLIENYVSEKNV